MFSTLSRAQWAIVAFLLLALEPSACQRCLMCGPEKEGGSCTPNQPMDVPKNITVSDSMCTTIENTGYHKDVLCKEFPAPKGYQFECQEAGGSQFSCRSTCGPSLDSIGTGPEFDLLNANGGGLLLGRNANRKSGRKGGLLDFSNFGNGGGFDFKLGNIGRNPFEQNNKLNNNEFNVKSDTSLGSGTSASSSSASRADQMKTSSDIGDRNLFNNNLFGGNLGFGNAISNRPEKGSTPRIENRGRDRGNQYPFERQIPRAKISERGDGDAPGHFDPAGKTDISVHKERDTDDVIIPPPEGGRFVEQSGRENPEKVKLVKIPELTPQVRPSNLPLRVNNIQGSELPGKADIESKSPTIDPVPKTAVPVIRKNQPLRNDPFARYPAKRIDGPTPNDGRFVDRKAYSGHRDHGKDLKENSDNSPPNYSSRNPNREAAKSSEKTSSPQERNLYPNRPGPGGYETSVPGPGLPRRIGGSSSSSPNNQQRPSYPGDDIELDRSRQQLDQGYNGNSLEPRRNFESYPVSPPSQRDQVASSIPYPARDPDPRGSRPRPGSETLYVDNNAQQYDTQNKGLDVNQRRPYDDGTRQNGPGQQSYPSTEYRNDPRENFQNRDPSTINGYRNDNYEQGDRDGYRGGYSDSPGGTAAPPEEESSRGVKRVENPKGLDGSRLRGDEGLSKNVDFVGTSLLADSDYLDKPADGRYKSKVPEEFEKPFEAENDIFPGFSNFANGDKSEFGTGKSVFNLFGGKKSDPPGFKNGEFNFNNKDFLKPNSYEKSNDANNKDKNSNNNNNNNNNNDGSNPNNPVGRGPYSQNPILNNRPLFGDPQSNYESRNGLGTTDNKFAPSAPPPRTQPTNPLPSVYPDRNSRGDASSLRGNDRPNLPYNYDRPVPSSSPNRALLDNASGQYNPRDVRPSSSPPQRDLNYNDYKPRDFRQSNSPSERDFDYNKPQTNPDNSGRRRLPQTPYKNPTPYQPSSPYRDAVQDSNNRYPPQFGNAQQPPRFDDRRPAREDPDYSYPRPPSSQSPDRYPPTQPSSPPQYDYRPRPQERPSTHAHPRDSHPNYPPSHVPNPYSNYPQPPSTNPQGSGDSYYPQNPPTQTSPQNNNFNFQPSAFKPFSFPSMFGDNDKNNEGNIGHDYTPSRYSDHQRQRQSQYPNNNPAPLPTQDETVPNVHVNNFLRNQPGTSYPGQGQQPHPHNDEVSRSGGRGSDSYSPPPYTIQPPTASGGGIGDQPYSYPGSDSANSPFLVNVKQRDPKPESIPPRQNNAFVVPFGTSDSFNTPGTETRAPYSNPQLQNRRPGGDNTNPLYGPPRYEPPGQQQPSPSFDTRSPQSRYPNHPNQLPETTSNTNSPNHNDFGYAPPYSQNKISPGTNRGFTPPFISPGEAANQEPSSYRPAFGPDQDRRSSGSGPLNYQGTPRDADRQPPDSVSSKFVPEALLDSSPFTFEDPTASDHSNPSFGGTQASGQSIPPYGVARTSPTEPASDVTPPYGGLGGYSAADLPNNREEQQVYIPVAPSGVQGAYQPHAGVPGGSYSPHLTPAGSGYLAGPPSSQAASREDLFQQKQQQPNDFGFTDNFVPFGEGDKFQDSFKSSGFQDPSGYFGDAAFTDDTTLEESNSDTAQPQK